MSAGMVAIVAVTDESVAVGVPVGLYGKALVRKATVEMVSRLLGKRRL
jgi:hypothetical protein